MCDNFRPPLCNARIVLLVVVLAEVVVVVVIVIVPAFLVRSALRSPTSQHRLAYSVCSSGSRCVPNGTTAMVPMISRTDDDDDDNNDDDIGTPVEGSAIYIYFGWSLL
jgi:hypothetical protein